MNVAKVERVNDYVEIVHDNGEGFVAVQPWDVVSVHWGGADDALIVTSRTGFQHAIRTADRRNVTVKLLQLLSDA
jgi:hypothetical protein